MEKAAMVESAHKRRDSTNRCHVIVFVTVILVWTILAIYNTVAISQARQELDSLTEKHNLLQISCERDNNEAGSGEFETGNVLSRVKREAGRSKKSKKRCKTSCNQRKRSDALHMNGFFDGNRYSRQTQEGMPITTGLKRADGTVILASEVYNTWKKSFNNGASKGLFDYNALTGKVRIKKSGYYLLYSQVTFHTDSDTATFGIYVNNEVIPLAECISRAPVITPRRSQDGAASRQECSQQRQQELSKTVKLRGKDVPDHLDGSNKYNEYFDSEYLQCGTQAARHLEKGDLVYIKSTSNCTIISVNRSWTFWGLFRI